MFQIKKLVESKTLNTYQKRLEKRGTLDEKIVKIELFFILVIILILIPLILFLVLPKLNADTWMGFLGGYLGAIIGIVGVVIGIKIQLDSDKQTRNDEKIDNTFLTYYQHFKILSII